MHQLCVFQARICNKDKGARVAAQRLSNRYYTNKNVECRNCNKTGHLSKNCPEPKVSSTQCTAACTAYTHWWVQALKSTSCVMCVSVFVCVQKSPPCFLCGNPGHLSNECPNRHCNNCGLPGHLYDSCSERAYWHKQCHRCSMTGHFFDVSIASCFICVDLK